MARTTSKVAAREAARRRKANADAERKRADQIELRSSTEFEVERHKRDTAEQAMAQHVQTLFTLPGMTVERAGELLDESANEVRRLRRLHSGDTHTDGASSDEQATASNGTVHDPPPVSEPDQAVDSTRV